MMRVGMAYYEPNARLEQDMLEADIEFGYDGELISVCSKAAWVDEFIALVKQDYSLEPVKVEFWDHYEE